MIQCRRAFQWRWAAFQFAAIALVVSDAEAQTRYTVTWLGNLGGWSTSLGVNDSGHVCGISQSNDPDYATHAFIWNGAIRDICPGGATAINSSDEVVGTRAYPGSLSGGFLYSNGQLNEIRGLDGQVYAVFPTVPVAINDAGQMVGSYSCCYVTTCGHALIHDRGLLLEWRDIGNLTGSPCDPWTGASAISINGIIAGNSATIPGRRAFLYDGTMHDLGVLPGFGQSFAQGVNASGQVVGYCNFPDNPTGFLFTSGVMQPITWGVPNAINDGGSIVGDGTIVSAGVARNGGIMQIGATVKFLDDIVESGSGWHISNATAISNSGCIAANGINPNVAGGQSQALLLTPCLSVLGATALISSCPLGSVSLSVNGTGSAPFTYQWQWRRIGQTQWLNIAAGANTDGVASFQSVGGLAPQVDITGYSEGGVSTGSSPRAEFQCIVSNACGSVTSNAATLSICYANCDCSTGTPVLSASDFSCFLSKFRAGDAYANCDGSTGTPALTAADFSCFLSAFRAGCP